METFAPCLHWSFSVAVLSGMWSFVVVVLHPYIQIRLKFFYVAIYLFTQCGSLEFILHFSVEALTNTVSLGALCLGLAVVYILYSQI